ncbi:unnamed protein product [Bursaphelenchus xylophilus]|uniref:(pine wood nematode) hypothetical protein n=1 Tax=Bursaphelenchus xylophilus TaxID=6326 RepID=A0A1I7SDA1_BURXY|nr:unnamed protein product [Bursaphelenchus xylophilus]CAG9130555.1 unnamed protein product [Bursaphelenchus xylophilus]
MSKYIERITHIENLLLIQNLVIDTSALREACAFGIPDLLRPLCWRLFLGFLPKERQEWHAVLTKQRADYKALVTNMIEAHIECSEEGPVDHPLSDGKDSQWAKFFADNDVLIQIDKDVRRLRPEIDFFQRISHYPLKEGQKLSARLNTLDNNGEPVEQPNGEYHWQVVERILFIYSKVNPGIKYVQGMNEIIGPIYYVFASDPDKEWAESAEADTFYCFQLLMSEIKDNFIKSLDSSSCGIEWTLAHFYQLFQAVDPELYHHVVIKLDVKAQFYAFRWLSLLLSQEFSLPDLINIWDTVFAAQNRMEATEFICLAMLCQFRIELLNGDFSQVVKFLQNYPVIDTSQLIALSWEIKGRQRSNNNNGQRSTGKFWNKERLSAMVNGAKERISNYTTSRRAANKSDGAISYRHSPS